jgi:hypothetical protein
MKSSCHSRLESTGASLKRLGLATIILFMASPFAGAQEAAPDSSKKEPEINVRSLLLATPSGYLPAELPNKNGILVVHEKKPAGLFFVYTNEGKNAADMLTQLKEMIVRMFLRDQMAQVEWKSSPLPARAKFPNDVGALWFAEDDKMEIQLAVFSRSLSAQDVACGYFAMRHKNGKFIDSSGKGVKEFDKFCSGFDPIRNSTTKK